MLIDQLNLLNLLLLLFVLYLIWRYCLHFWLEEEQTCFVGILWFVSVFVLCNYFPFELSSFLVKQNIVLKHCSIEVLNLHNILIIQKKKIQYISGYYCKSSFYSEITLTMKNQVKVVSIVSQCPGGISLFLIWWLWGNFDGCESSVSSDLSLLF